MHIVIIEDSTRIPILPTVRRVHFEVTSGIFRAVVNQLALSAHDINDTVSILAEDWVVVVCATGITLIGENLPDVACDSDFAFLYRGLRRISSDGLESRNVLKVVHQVGIAYGPISRIQWRSSLRITGKDVALSLSCPVP